METAVGQLGALYAIWLREVKRALRDRGQLVGGLSRPILWVILLGIGLNPYFRGEVYGEFGFLREILVSPMPRALILFGKVLGGATVAMVHGSLVLALARFADVSLTWADVLHGLGLMFLLSFAMTSFGVIIANHIRSFEGFGVFSNAVILPLYFTSSSVFPLDPALTRAQALVVYPEWLVALVEINPLTYAVDALRGAFIHFHQFSPMLGPIIIAAMAVGFFIVALFNFRRS